MLDEPVDRSVPEPDERVRAPLLEIIPSDLGQSSRGGVAKGCHARKAGFTGRTRERASPNNSNDRPDRQREIVHASHRDKRVSGPRRRVVTGCLRYSILPVTRV